MVEAHVGWEPHGHLAYAEISKSFSFQIESYIPKGPTISTIFGGSVVVMFCFRLAGGSRNLRSTPCGSDKGALPIRDLHPEVVENGLRQ